MTFYGIEIFLDNDATREYLDICRGALARELTDEYYEEHQIIPSPYWFSLPNAEKGKLQQAMPKDSRVSCKLLPAEHYRCHHLLTQMFVRGSRQHSVALIYLIRRRADTPE